MAHGKVAGWQHRAFVAVILGDRMALILCLILAMSIIPFGSLGVMDAGQANISNNKLGLIVFSASRSQRP